MPAKGGKTGTIRHRTVLLSVAVLAALLFLSSLASASSPPVVLGVSVAFRFSHGESQPFLDITAEVVDTGGIDVVQIYYSLIADPLEALRANQFLGPFEMNWVEGDTFRGKFLFVIPEATSSASVRVEAQGIDGEWSEPFLTGGTSGVDAVRIVGPEPSWIGVGSPMVQLGLLALTTSAVALVGFGWRRFRERIRAKV